MAGPQNGVSFAACMAVYQETLYYFLKNLMAVFWYILQGMAAPLKRCEPLQRTGSAAKPGL
jgi:hypothetical protein